MSPLEKCGFFSWGYFLCPAAQRDEDGHCHFLSCERAERWENVGFWPFVRHFSHVTGPVKICWGESAYLRGTSQVHALNCTGTRYASLYGLIVGRIVLLWRSAFSRSRIRHSAYIFSSCRSRTLPAKSFFTKNCCLIAFETLLIVFSVVFPFGNSRVLVYQGLRIAAQGDIMYVGTEKYAL